MDDLSLACYRLGLRLRQAVLILDHADRSSGPADCDAEQHALGRLAVAFDEWVRLVGVGAERVARFGAGLLDSAATRLASTAEPRDTLAPPGSLAGQLRALESACLEWAGTRPAGRAPHGTWLRLGVEIATVEYVPPARRVVIDDEPARCSTDGQVRPVWRWDRPAVVESLLADLRVARDTLFPADEALDSADGFAGGLPSLSHSPGWAVLEVGLSRRARQPAAKATPRPCYDRDHQFLAWYEAEDTTTYHSPAAIRDRWNEQYPREEEKWVTRDVVVKAISLARRERDGAAAG